MSEVLSGAQIRAGRFTILPADERQSLRLARFLMGAGTSLLICVSLLVLAFLGLLSWRAALEGTAGIVALVLVFFAVFRTGLNLRFSDPSLTAEQVGAAILWLSYLMYHAGPARESFTLFYLVAMLFGVLRLNVRRLMGLALLALVAHGTVLQLLVLSDPGLDPRAALTEFAVLMVVLPWFAVMGGYVNRLRVRLSDSHRDLKQAMDKVGELAIRDELTGAYNRRFLVETLARERMRAARRSEPLSVCMVDIDHFKAINDTLGHAAGDEVLKAFAKLAPHALRGIDTFGRFGGEEFLILLPGTQPPGAIACAERVRAAAAAAAFPGLPAGRQVTVSVGVATYVQGDDADALLARADRALYQAKAGGRNKVCSLS